MLFEYIPKKNPNLGVDNMNAENTEHKFSCFH